MVPSVAKPCAMPKPISCPRRLQVAVKAPIASRSSTVRYLWPPPGYNFHLLLRWLELLLSRFLAAQNAAADLQWVSKSKTSRTTK
jgi:hypothetical protein